MPVVAFSFADPSPWLQRAKDAGCSVVCQVQTIAAADRAAELGTDVLVAQGDVAGGHTGAEDLMALLTRVIRDHPDVPVLAAGGISNGAKLAEVLHAGADGAWVGTPLLATVESTEVSADYKRRLVEARSTDTVRTQVFDTLDPAVFGVPPWPDGIAGRVVRNAMVDDWHDRIDDLKERVDEIVPGYLAALEKRDVSLTAVYGGVSVDDITKVRSVREVLEQICSEAERLI
ncbi:MAG: nitronate monooxygenase [Gammaproteobacteria bacterium]